MSSNKKMEYCELKLNRSLLDANFDGYKVSMDNVHFKTQKLEQICEPRKPSPKMHTLPHMLVFSKQNRLFCDETEAAAASRDTEHLYRILDTGHIQSMVYEKTTGVCHDSIVESVGDVAARDELAYPPNLIFTANNLAIASNGLTEIVVFLVVSPTNWCRMLRFEPSDRPGISLIDARVVDGKLRILAHRVDCDAEKATRNQVFHVVVNFDDVDTAETLSVEKIDRFVVGGCLETCTFGGVRGAQIVVLASQKPFLDGDEPTRIDYTWQKTGGTVRVVFEMGAKVEKEDVAISLTDRKIRLCVNDRVLLDGHLFGEIDEEDVELSAAPDATTLTLTLKASDDETTTWKTLLAEHPTPRARGAGACGEEFDEAEECDEADVAYSFYWIDAETGKVVKQCDASGRQVLFTHHSGVAPAIVCLRHDVDGVIWRLDDVAAPRHHATLHAFGYVQASKTARVWSGSSRPSHKYAAIAETRHRVLVYSQHVELAGSLSNRRTATSISHVAKQHLLRLECADAICGVHLTDQHIFVLTTQHIHVAELNF